MTDEIREYINLQNGLYSSNINWNNMSTDTQEMRQDIHDSKPTDRAELFTYNNEFKIIFSKQKKLFTMSKFGQYDCSIEFRNSIDIPILKIVTTEKEFLRTAEEISLFLSSYGSIYDSMIYFGEYNNANHFIFLSYCNMQGEYPQEEDDAVSFSLYSNVLNQGNKLRLSFITLSDFLQDFIHSIYQILVDIPYVDELIHSTISDLYENFYNSERYF